MLSSCVGEQSSLEMNAPLSASQSNNLANNLTAQTVSVDGLNTYQSQSAANAGFVSPYPAGSPIPTKAPRQIVQNTAAPVPQSAVTAQVNEPVSEQTPTLVTALAVPTRNPNKAIAQVANATSIANPADTVEPSQVQDQVQAQTFAYNSEVSEPTQKSNFFTRWADSINKQKQASNNSPKKNSYLRRGRGDDSGTGVNNSIRKKVRQPQLASLTPSSTSVSTNAALTQTDANKTSRRSSEQLNALPGVKSNNEIFGIEEHGDEPGTQVAALGGLARISPNGLRVQHDKVQVACLKQGVLQILKKVERRYGKKPIITSGYRSPKRNRRAGGARNSQHIYCKAVDIQVEGVSKWNLAKYLRSIPGRGGVGTYCRTKSVHIDIGSKRDWHSKCRRSSVKKRKKRKNT